MAGSRKPGTLGRAQDVQDLNDGTMARVCSPRPGILGTVAHAKEELQDPPAFGRFDAIRLWTLQGEPVIYEYQDSERLVKLTYENQIGRSYYRVGDLILVARLRKHVVESIFPELKEAGKDEPSAADAGLWIALTLIAGFEEPEQTIGWRITDIAHAGGGKGVVTMQGIIFLDEQTPLLLTKTDQWTRLDLNNSFVFARTARNLQWIVNMGQVVAGFTELVLSGGTSMIRKAVAKKLLKTGGRIAIRKGFGRVMFRFVKVINSALAKATVAFALDAAKELRKQVEFQKEVERLKGYAPLGKPPEARSLEPAIKAALVQGAGSFALTLLDELWKDHVIKALAKSLNEYFPNLDFKSRLKRFLIKEAIEAATKEPFQRIVKTITEAAAASWDGKGKFDPAKFDRQVSEKAGSILSDYLRDKVQGWGSSMADEISNDL